MINCADLRWHLLYRPAGRPCYALRAKLRPSKCAREEGHPHTTNTMTPEDKEMCLTNKGRDMTDGRTIYPARAGLLELQSSKTGAAHLQISMAEALS